MATQSTAEKSLIVLSAPSIDNDYYEPDFDGIVNFMVNFAKQINGKDEVVILANVDTLPSFKGKVPSNILIEADVCDIWIRDFSPVIPSKQIKFKYLPSCSPEHEAKEIDESFLEWFSKNGLEYQTKTDIVLDGGNVVDNAAGTRVIVTERILRDNPSLSKADAKTKLKELLGVKEVAIIPEPANHTTGHSDGSVAWPTDDKILLLKRDEPTHSESVNELKSSFPGVEIVEVPNHIPHEKNRDFDTAINCFVNCVVTDGYIYMPTFNDPHDDEMLKLFQSHTNKTVVPIQAENVARLGGSVRCLTWQTKAANKTKILKLVEK
jgi:agmatine/peptidylarginine deiminase